MATKKNRGILFGFRVSDEEREKIRVLAESLKRSESDAVRVTLDEAYEKLQKDTTKATPCE